MVELLVRLVFSLAVVLGLLVLLSRLSAKRFRGGVDAPIRVMHRQPLTRSSAVAVLQVGSRTLLVGTTEQSVQLLAELDPSDLEDAAPAAAPEPAPAARASDRALAGSVLSAQTWRQALAAATRRAEDAS